MPFTGQSPYHVGLFVSISPYGGFFDSRNVAFTIQGVRPPNATFTGNLVTPSNVARGADTALVTVGETYDRYRRPLGSTVQSFAIRGDGASIRTQQYVSNSVTSTGPLGDLTLLSPQGITDVTAPSLFGSITAAGPITGTIQTTACGPTRSPAPLRSSRPTWAAFTWPRRFGPYLTSTTINSEGGLPGRIISRGNLLSAINSDGGISGVIAAQGNLGAVVGPANTRVGGILSNGNFSGQLVVLGSEYGNVILHGGLNSGRVAVKGGIFGNLLIDGGLDSSAALVSDGAIGSPAAGTRLTVTGRNAGIVAANGSINSAPIGGVVFNNAGATPGNPNAAAIDAIFTQQSAPLALDVLPQDLQGLSSILQDLAASRLNAKGILTGPIGQSAKRMTPDPVTAAQRKVECGRCMQIVQNAPAGRLFQWPA